MLRSSLSAAASGGPIVTLTGDFATRTRLLALPALHEASLIHIATHGEANEAEPERSGLWLAEEGGVSPRVSPFAELRDLGGLLQRAGFAMPVVDSDRLTVTYADALALMRELRGTLK